MIMKKLIIILINIFVFKFIFSVETINAPFISKLTFEVSNRQVLLKWKNPPNFNDNISIYRSNKIIDNVSKVLKAEKIIILENKEEKYIDSLKDYGEYYYAVIITGKSDNEDKIILVPYRNYTLKPAVINKSDFFEINSFKTESKNTYIRLEWDYKSDSDSSIKVLIYRHTKPITDIDQLNNSIKIGTLDINTKMFIDVPAANIEYYYAIFLEGEKIKNFQENINISLNPVSIKSVYEIFPDFSIDNFIPLPLLAINNDPKSGKIFLDPQILKNPKKISYDEKTKEIIIKDRNKFNELYNEYASKNQEKIQRLNFHILNNEEIYEPKEYLNEYNTALNYIKNNEYDKALIIYQEIIKEILPDDLLERVSYYIGMINYIKGNFYISYLYLIYPYDKYRKEIFPYLNSIYYNIFSTLER